MHRVGISLDGLEALREVLNEPPVNKTVHAVPQSCLTLCDPVDCSPWGSSAHGIVQARILEWAAISSSRESSQTRDQTRISCIGDAP